MATHQVTFIDQHKNFRQTIAVPDTETILNEAAEQGIKIPFECVVGACAVCESKLISGTVDQEEQMVLSEKRLAEGYIIACVAKPTSDCVLEVTIDNYL